MAFDTVLIANRGAIAVRVIRTLRKLGIRSVAVYSEADVGSRHVSLADQAVLIGPAPAAASYLDQAAILAAARATGAQAIHPGYGFLSENAEFAQACADAGIVFIGPTPENMRAFSLKHSARALAQAHGVPLAPGSGLLTDPADAVRAAAEIGYPVMLKATAGGGGIGMRVCADAAEVADAFASVARLGAGNFGDAGVFLERFVARARHIEVQVFGDGQGRVVALGERDCSLQRRNQKVVEETPAPLLPAATRAALIDAALRLTRAAHYQSAGTVEFLYDASRGDFYFLEVNTRLQVEHGVTEQVTGVDLVEWMVRGAGGDFGFLDTPLAPPQGHAIQVRLYAEDPSRDFAPSAGRLIEVTFPAGPRVDGWVESGSDVPAWYDPMLAKLIVTASTRDQAVADLQAALDDTRLAGIETNLAWLRTVVRAPAFTSGQVSTRALSEIVFQPSALRVLSAGPSTTVQDYPGRLGLWNIGVPPSGPMDARSFRLGNRLLGNAPDAAGLEFTAAGPTLQFLGPARICLAGADFAAALDGVPLAPWQVVGVAAGQQLRIGRVTGPGLRGYLLVAGGIAAPVYLGSRSAFTLGEFGGHAGRALMTGDTLHFPLERDGKKWEPVFAKNHAKTNTLEHDDDSKKRHHALGVGDDAEPCLPAELRPVIGSAWTLRVLYGPHGAPDFFTADDIAMIESASWQVHYNSNRTGVRLIGPKPQWARRDGGEAGLHPSNIHDNAYAIGAVDFTGDMPIILGPDGPSLGGFVCPFVVIQADLWKLGQLSPGDTVHFAPVSEAEAVAAEVAQDQSIAVLERDGKKWEPVFAKNLAKTKTLEHDDVSEKRHHALVAAPLPDCATDVPDSPILHVIPAAGVRPLATYRRQGDRHLLVEYGAIVLDLELRLRVHALMQELERMGLPGVIDVTPGVRSLQIHYDSRVLHQTALLAALIEAEDRLGGLDDFAIASRVVYLPLSWDDPAIHQTIDKYRAAVRDDAPWCPDNIEFIRRVNGLAAREDVQRIVFDAEYLVLGLGDVYLGAPVATPVDPRHRLVTTKYNPARTWTPPNVVGIGGAYMCIYGMEGPGGYQLFGRTIQVWNTWRQTEAFQDGKPWLLRFFDRIRFFPVSHQELTEWRRDFPLGRRAIRIAQETFRLADYRRFLADNAPSIAAFQTTREAAFAAERLAWEQSGEFDRVAALSEAAAGGPVDAAAIDLPAGSELVEAPFGGSIWKMLAGEGSTVTAGEPIAVIEAMKMECPVPSPASGVVRRVYVGEGQVIAPGAPMLAIEPA